MTSFPHHRRLPIADMVLSASAVRSYDDDGSAQVIFGKQVL